MYVDIIACKRGRVKVDVTLARRTPAEPVPTVINIPVKIADTPVRRRVAVSTNAFVKSETEDIVEIVNIDTCAPELEQYEPSDISTPDSGSDQEEVLELLAMTGNASADTAETVDFFTVESTPEEDLSAIDELLSSAGEDIAEESFDDVVADALEELDDMNHRADAMRERLDGQLADALEEITGSADEDSERLTSTIDRELESLDSVLGQREEANEQQPERFDGAEQISYAADTSAYMRYFDRDAQGGRVAASRDNATGQEVICIDESSGRLSRVCGIMYSRQ